MNPTLKLLAANTVMTNIPRILLVETSPTQDDEQWEVGVSYNLRSDVELPRSLWNILLGDRRHTPWVSQDHKIWLFLAMSKITKLASKSTFSTANAFVFDKLVLSNLTGLTDKALTFLMRHFPSHLELHNCPVLSENSFLTINTYGRNLKTLVFGNSTQLFPKTIATLPRTKEEEEESVSASYSASYFNQLVAEPSIENSDDWRSSPSKKLQGICHTIQMLQTPNVEKLVVWGLDIVHEQKVEPRYFKWLEKQELFSQTICCGSFLNHGVDYWETMFNSCLQNLIHLDLSGCIEFANLDFLRKAIKLERLILSGVTVISDENNDGWDVIRGMTTLRHLDISQFNELVVIFEAPDRFLADLISQMVNLQSLDISGTNLAGDHPEEILGLKSLRQQPLQFLGLVSCAQQNDPSSRPYIPAKLVTGHASFQQLLNSLRVYQNWSHHEILCKVILLLHKKLHETAPFDVAPSMLGLLLDELLGMVEAHLHEKYVVMVSITCIFTIVKLLEAHENARVALSKVLDAKMVSGASQSTQSGRILHIVLEISEKYWTDTSLIYQVVPLVFFLKGPLNRLGLLKGTNFRRLVGAVLRQIVFALTPSDLKTGLFRLMKMVFVEITTETEEEEAVSLRELNPVKEICTCIRRLLLAGNLELVDDCWRLLAGLTDQSEHHCVAFTASGGLDLFLDTVSSPRLVDQSSTSEIPMMTLCNLVSHETCSAHCFNNTLIFHFVLKTVGLTDRTAAWTPEDVLDQFPGENNFTMEYIATMYLVTFLEADGRFSWDEIDWGEVCPQVRSKHGLSCYLTALMTTRWGRFLEFDDGIEHESLDHFLRLCDNRKNLACRIFGLWSLVHLTSTRPEEYSPMLSLALRDANQIRTELRGLQVDSSPTLDSSSGDAS